MERDFPHSSWTALAHRAQDADSGDEEPDGAPTVPRVFSLPTAGLDSDKNIKDDAAATCEPAAAKQSLRRKRQFRFSADSEMTLLRSVCALTPWEAVHGKMQAVWEEIAETLRASGLQVDGKRAKAKFDALIKGWKDRVAIEERQSGVDVDYGEREILLEDIKTAMDDWNIAGRQAAAEAQNNKVKADTEGKNLREASLTGLIRKRNCASDEDLADAEVLSASKRRRSVSSSSKFEQAFLELSESYVRNLQGSTGTKEKELEIQERKIALEEKKLAFEMEERAAARQSQETTMQAMLGLIKGIAENNSQAK
jgi:hypothetical protein